MAINYLEIKKQIRQKLSKPIDFEDTDNLLELGLSSLVIMKLVNQWRKQGIKISFGVLMEHPTLREWWELIQKTLEKADSKKRTAKKEKRIIFSKAQYSSDDGKIQLPIEIDKEQKETILRWINDLLKEGMSCWI